MRFPIAKTQNAVRNSICLSVPVGIPIYPSHLIDLPCSSKYFWIRTLVFLIIQIPKVKHHEKAY